MNYAVMLALGLVVICAIALIVHNMKEGFSVAQYVAQATKEESVFSQTMPNGVFTNKGLVLNPTQLNKALEQTDLYEAKNPSADYSPLFQEDPEGIFQSQDEQFCAGVTDPRNLPDRGMSRVGCGWVFRADPAQQSKGAIGTSRGPIFAAGNEGQWIWDMQVAIEMEDIKQCAKLTSCENVDGADFTGKCGFCPDLGRGVPITSSGAVRYPNDSNGGNCASMPVKSAALCAVPSDDTGSSLPAGAGAGGASGASPNVCATSGPLSANCIIQQAIQAGMSTAGAFIARVNNPTGRLSETQTEAFRILTQAGYILPTTPYNISRITALNQCSAVVKAQVSGANTQIKAAAGLVASGTLFDICSTDANAVGPFKVPCMQQEFRKAGCQAAGAEYPKTQDEANADSLGKKMTDVRTMYTALYNRMASTDGTVADKAVKDCLGIKVSRPAGSTCDTSWIKPAVAEGFVTEGFAPQQQQVFMLQSHNYPNYLMRSMGANAQTLIVVGKSTGSSLTVIPGLEPGTIQIAPQVLPGTVMTTQPNGSLITASASSQDPNSSFRIVPGLADPKKVSFQSSTNARKYLRHSGFMLFSHGNDGSPIFAQDATFQPLDMNGNPTTMSLPSVNVGGWESVSAKASTIGVGVDDAIWYSGSDGSTGMIKGATTSADRSAPFKMMVDCASATKAVSVGNNGILYMLDANKRWASVKTVGPPVTSASIADDGTIGFVNRAREIYRGKPGLFKKLPGAAVGISLGKTGDDIYVVGTDQSLFIWREGRNTWENIANPPGTQLKQLAVSKDGFKVAAISTNGKLYGLDVFNKWSEIPNQPRINYVGINKNILVGATGSGAYKKTIKVVEGFTTPQHPNPTGYVKSLGRYPESDVNIGCFANKGIEETKADCTKNPDCAGFSYAKNGGGGCFKKGPLNPDMRFNDQYDGFTKDPLPKFTQRANLPSTVVPRQGAVIGNIKVAENYRLSFNITPKGLVGNWGSILHFTVSGKDCCNPGDRAPGIWFFPGGLTLHVRIGDQTNGNWGIDVAGCQMGKTSKVVIECRNSVVNVSVDGNKATLAQPTKRPVGQATVYSADPFYMAANAQIANLMYEYL